MTDNLTYHVAQSRAIKTVFVLILSFLSFPSCRKYLNAKPDKSLTTPSTLHDLQSLMDYDAFLNSGYPSSGEVASDNFYITSNDYNSLSSMPDKNFYIWADETISEEDWQQAYQMIYYCNVALDNIDKVQRQAQDQPSYNAIKGSALFFRAYILFKTAQIYTLPYNQTSAERDLGLPLKLSSDINDKTVRSTVQQTYEQILTDLKQSVLLLPITSKPITRPNKAAALATLACVYLVIGDYDEANIYADSCLQLKSALMDYNSLNPNDNIPISLFNDEVIFQARLNPGGGSILSPSICKVDSDLYKSYSEGDLRKTIFFKSNSDNSFSFKGSYDGNINYTFSGIATDEIYLVKAESLARLGKAELAMSYLNKLLRNRWKTGAFMPLVADNPEDALTKILKERRKELAFRGGIRWMDLRRLNQEQRLAVVLKRKINGSLYTLLPKDLRYAFLIPQNVIDMSGIQQNAR